MTDGILNTAALADKLHLRIEDVDWLLCLLGYQTKKEGDYRLTHQGLAYGEEKSYIAGTSTKYILLWGLPMVEKIKEVLDMMPEFATKAVAVNDMQVLRGEKHTQAQEWIIVITSPLLGAVVSKTNATKAEMQKNLVQMVYEDRKPEEGTQSTADLKTREFGSLYAYGKYADGTVIEYQAYPLAQIPAVY